MNPHYSPKQVAKALHVSESSVKRWCDSGAIQSFKTVGGHRRVSKEALDAFLRVSNRTVVKPELLTSIPTSKETGKLIRAGNDGLTIDSGSGQSEDRKPEHEREGELRLDDSLRDKFADALSKGDEACCRSIYQRLLVSGASIAKIGDQLICPTLRRIGEDWACDKLDIYQERRGCEILVRLIQMSISQNVPATKNAQLAMGAAPSNDPYTLPGYIIESLLGELGWRAINLGVNIPFSSLITAIRRERPRLFWLSISTIVSEPEFVADLRAFLSQIPKETSLIVGGRALTPAVRAQLPQLSYCESLEQLRGYVLALNDLSSSRVE